MLLKIECNYDDREWWLFDKIDRIVTYAPIIKKLYDNGEDSAVDVHVEIFNHSHVKCDCSNVCVCNDNISIRRVCARLSNGEEILIAFDTKAYLCNDEGSTLEILVP